MMSSSITNAISLKYQQYSSRILPTNRWKLKEQLDFEHGGVEEHLVEIAEQMVGWEHQLAHLMNLRRVPEVKDILAINQDSPQLQRRHALRIWKDKFGIDATYERLLNIFLKGNNTTCAEVIVQLLGPIHGIHRVGICLQALEELTPELVEEFQHKIRNIESQCFSQKLLKREDFFNISTTTSATVRSKQLLYAVCSSIQNVPERYSIFLEILERRSMQHLVISINDKVFEILERDTVRSKPRPPIPQEVLSISKSREEMILNSKSTKTKQESSESTFDQAATRAVFKEEQESGIMMEVSKNVETVGDEFASEEGDEDENPTIQDLSSQSDTIENEGPENMPIPFPQELYGNDEDQETEIIEKSPNNSNSVHAEPENVQIAGRHGVQSEARDSTETTVLIPGVNSGANKPHDMIRQTHLLTGTELDKEIQVLKDQLNLKKIEKENLTKKIDETEKALTQEKQKREELEELKQRCEERIKKLKENNRKNTEQYKRRLKEMEDQWKHDVEKLTKQKNELEKEQRNMMETADAQRKEYEETLKLVRNELEMVKLENEDLELITNILEKVKKKKEEITRLENIIKEMEHEKRIKEKEHEKEKIKHDYEMKLVTSEAEKKEAEYRGKLESKELEKEKAELEKEKAEIEVKYLKEKCEKKDLELMLVSAGSSAESSTSTSPFFSFGAIGSTPGRSLSYSFMRRQSSITSPPQRRTVSCSLIIKFQVTSTESSPPNTFSEIED